MFPILCIVVDLFIVKAQYYYSTPNLATPYQWNNLKTNFYPLKQPTFPALGTLGPILTLGQNLPPTNIPFGCNSKSGTTFSSVPIPSLPPVINPPALPVPAPSATSLSPPLPAFPSPCFKAPPGPKCNPPTARAFYLPTSSSQTTFPPVNPVPLLPPVCNPPISSNSLTCSDQLTTNACPCQSIPDFSQTTSFNQLSASLYQSKTYSCPFCGNAAPPAPNPKLQPPPCSSSVLPGIIDEIPTIANRLKQPLSLDSEPVSAPPLPLLPFSLPGPRSRLPFPPPTSIPIPECNAPMPPPFPIKSRYDLDLLNGFLSSLGF